MKKGTKNLYKISMQFRWAFKILAIFFSISKKNKDKIKILMYHSVGSGSKIELDISIKTFLKQITYLQKKGRIVNLHEALANLKRPKMGSNQFVLTFDDGFDNFYTNVFPILKKKKIPAVLFPALEFIEDPSNIPITPEIGEWKAFTPLSKSQVKELADSDLIEFGSHGYFHYDYSVESITKLENDINISQSWFNSFLNISPKTFCYPRGKSNAGSQELVNRYFDYAFTSAHDGNEICRAHPMLLPRIPILRTDGFFWFKQRINGWLFLDQILLKKFFKLFKL